jgi:hypothetical protein
MVSFPHPLLPTVQGEPDYQTIHATRKFFLANLRAIDTHLDGGTLGHLELIISDASYAMIDPAMDSGPTLWTSPQAPGRAPRTRMEQLPKLAPLTIFWRRAFKLTGHAPLCKKL